MQHIGVLSGRVCAKEFVDAVKHHMLHLLQRRKTHIRLYLIQCMNEFGPSSAFNAERYVFFASCI